MSGYGNADDDMINAMATTENALAIVRANMKTGAGTLVCLGCGDPISAARKEASPSADRCVLCQAEEDKYGPKIRHKNLTRIL